MFKSIVFLGITIVAVSCESGGGTTGRREAVRLDSTEAAAMTAYEQHRYDDCGRIFLALAVSARTDAARADQYYKSACCHSLAGRPALAFSLLTQAIELGIPYLSHVLSDSDFAPLHASNRWEKIISLVGETQSRQYTNPALRDELLARAARDQVARQRFSSALQDEGLRRDLIEIDSANTTWLKQVIAEFGWPTQTMVGRDGASVAWLLVQHADQDLDFQRTCLSLIKSAASRGEADIANVAYLEDRVAVAEKRPQVYGTQFIDNITPFPIEDPSHVNERRATVGLNTLEEYKKEMQSATRTQSSPDDI